MISFVQLAIVLFVALGSWTYGYCSAIIATTLGQPTFLHYLSLDTASNAASLFEAINALFAVGGFFGCLANCYLADELGRRKAILLGAVLAIVGSGLQAGTVHVAMFIVARAITGFSVGLLVTLVPLYQSEIAPPKIRGFLVSMHGVALCFGYLNASWLGFGFYFVHANDAQWRVPLAIQAAPPLLLAIGVMFVPESPRWLLMKDRDEDAIAAFKTCRAESAGETDEEAIREEFHLLQLQVQEEMKLQMPIIEFAKQAPLRKRCVVALLTMAANQGTGTLVINNYAALVYARLGLDTKMQLLLNACWLCLGPPGNLYNGFMVDKVGRVRMMIIGLSGCAVALIGECVSVSIFQDNGSRPAAKTAVFFLFLHLFFFASHLDATSYIYSAEIFPNPVRARGLSIGVSGLFLSSLVYLSAAPTAFENIGWKYYLVFLCVTVANIIIIFTWFPETKGMALEDVADQFGDGIVLSNPKEEQVHQRFKDSHYAVQVLHDAVDEDDASQHAATQAGYEKHQIEERIETSAAPLQ